MVSMTCRCATIKVTMGTIIMMTVTAEPTPVRRL